eukprot:10562322-Alexandrium_andersonii.AAC.1
MLAHGPGTCGSCCLACCAPLGGGPAGEAAGTGTGPAAEWTGPCGTVESGGTVGDARSGPAASAFCSGGVSA